MSELDIKHRVKESVFSGIDLSESVRDEEIRALIDECIVRETKDTYMSLKEKVALRATIFNSFRGLDILSEYLEDEDISEIMVNGHNCIFVERRGRIERANKVFDSEEKLLAVIQQIVAGCNRRINEANPIVDARLADGSRVNIVLQPISLGGNIVTIRRFPKQIIDMKKLISIGSITSDVARVLELFVRAGYNIFISGGTGSGKTTFLNALSDYIPKDERIITIEDSAELQIRGVENLVRLEARTGNVEGENEISIRDLIKSSLRMRPDRIIVGEVRDAAAIDMLQAMNTGHDGSISTGHANSSEDMISRLETMVLMGVDIPLMAVKKQIAAAVDIIIHLGRMRDKSRKVLAISEVIGMLDGEVKLNCLYEFVEEGRGEVVYGCLRKINDLMHANKLAAAGLLDDYKEVLGEA